MSRGVAPRGEAKASRLGLLLPGLLLLGALGMLTLACDQGKSQGASGGVAGQAVPGAASEDRPNILLISIDTLRADHLGSYGYGRNTSPHLDRLASRGFRYQRALAPTPWTLPSHGALLTGVDPYLLGLTAQWRYLPPQAPSLASLLAEAGYRTAAFVDSKPRGFVGGRRGFDRGFGTYAHAPHGPTQVPRYDVAATVDAALGWLDATETTTGAVEEGDSKSPFFLFLHTRSVHAIPTDEPCRDAPCSPYFAPAPFGERFVTTPRTTEPWDNGAGRQGQDYLWWINEEISSGTPGEDLLTPRRLAELIAFYDGAIAYTDHHLGRLFEALAERGLADDTWVVVTSDHGEAFLEHRLLMHQEVYEPSLRVPLIVARPGDPEGEGTVIRSPVVLEDVAPTLLQWAAVDGEAAGASPMTGRPLPRQEPAPETPPRQLFFYYLFPEKFAYRAFAVEHGDDKLVAHNPIGDDLEMELWKVDRRGYGETQGAAPGDASSPLEPLRRSLRRQLQREPMGIVEDPAHRSPEAAGGALDTLGYID